MKPLTISPLTREDFAPFGDVLECGGPPDKIINQGLCGRWHDLAGIDIVDGQAGISLFRSDARQLPYRLDMVERHPLGSQAFIPMTEVPFLVVVAENVGERPSAPRAFRTAPGQGVNYHRNVWHGVLAPLSDPGLFAVIDRIGAGDNLEEYWFETPFLVSD